ncbi:MAG: bifunctional DNA-formamidopyrimidine glycosylase/DNA-(apurinic or apyrimidinic site) lyase [Gemmatimonadota bacterium]|jgi:formamidopyrimidine-DNA glycosylase
MPELPEAETIVRGLRPALVGRAITATDVVHADVLREPAGRFTRDVAEREILEVDRRGKNVVMRLSGDRVLAVNLGMTGRLLPSAGNGGDPMSSTHPAVVFELDDGERLVFDDTRRFGTVECLPGGVWLERSERMGPEPLAASFTGEMLWERLRRSRSPVRSWLLDQKRIAGIGNIYANEALHLAGVHPQRPARSVTRAEAGALHRGVRRVLREAINAGGTTLRDYRNASGGEGLYGRRLLVYGRDGQPCSRCHSEIRRVVFGGRSAFYCPGCQPRRRGRR